MERDCLPGTGTKRKRKAEGGENPSTKPASNLGTRKCQRNLNLGTLKVSTARANQTILGTTLCPFLNMSITYTQYPNFKCKLQIIQEGKREKVGVKEGRRKEERERKGRKRGSGKWGIKR